MKLWVGRLTGKMDAAAEQLNNSLPFDQPLAQEDVLGSIAWAKALKHAGVLSETETLEIIQGLKIIKVEFETDTFNFQESDEDIHTAVERRLIEIIGSVAGKLHTGRSRNDQVATDFCLWLQKTASCLGVRLKELQIALLDRAEKDMGIILPGYTHFQQAQPILLSHWWLSHFWAFQRDGLRLHQVFLSSQIMPLGCAALAGTSFPIDRFILAADLGFDSPCPNSLDGVSNRDFAAEFLFWSALLGVHLSRLAEALILYSTSEFGFLSLADEFSTGSSLMPQKKNPDPLELTRAKSGVLIGKLTGLLCTLKALPSAYDKDLQEDKLPVFEAADLMNLLLPMMAGLITSLTIHPERMRAAIQPQILATDLADFLVKRRIPFRQAHSLVGQAVKRAEELSVELPELPLAEWQQLSPLFTQDLYHVFDIDYSIAQRAAWGGTAPNAVKQQLESARSLLKK